MAAPKDSTLSGSSKASQAIDPALPEKKRARRRLIGALALCVLGGTGLSLVLDHEPKAPTPELVLTSTTKVEAPQIARVPSAKGDAPTLDPTVQAVPSLVAPIGSAAGAASSNAGISVGIPDQKTSAIKPPIKPEPKKADEKVAVKAPEKTAEKVAEKSISKPVPGFLLQAGAFSSADAAKPTLEKLKELGLKGFTEQVETPAGKRTRVRAGPFPSKEAAIKARDQLRGKGIEAALIAPA
jgi:DedD protein